MTCHDSRLLVSNKATEKRRRTRKALIKGVFSITLFPRSPNIEIKSIGDDWRAVGDDIRKAMKSWDSHEACE